jgi:hypothetical protein
MDLTSAWTFGKRPAGYGLPAEQIDPETEIFFE